MPYIYKSGLQFGTGNITINQTTPIREMTQVQYDALPTSEKLSDTIFLINDASADKLVVDDPAPIGAIMAYGGVTAPTGWLLCQGQEVSRVLYSELFAAIGTTYGSGDGTTTFNVPDLRGNVAVGANQDYGLGDSGGETNHLLTQSEIPKYNIGYLQVPVPNGHGQWSNSGVNASSVSNELGWSGKSNFVSNTGINSAADTSVIAYGWKLDTNGGSQTHNNMQPYIVTNYIIKAKDNSTASTSVLSMIDFFYPVGSYYETSDGTFNPNTTWGGTWELENEGLVHIGSGTNYTLGSTGGEITHTLIVNEIPTHTHGIIQASSGTGSAIVPNTSSTTPTSGTFLINAYDAGAGWVTSGSQYVGTAAWNANTKSAGGGTAHNNMQPYKVVNRWHRTA